MAIDCSRPFDDRHTVLTKQGDTCAANRLPRVNRVHEYILGAVGI